MKRHLYLNRRSWHDRGLKSTVQIHDPSQSCSQSPDKYGSVSRLERRQQQRASPEAIRHAAFSDFFYGDESYAKFRFESLISSCGKDGMFSMISLRPIFSPLPPQEWKSSLGVQVAPKLQARMRKKQKKMTGRTCSPFLTSTTMVITTAGPNYSPSPAHKLTGAWNWILPTPPLSCLEPLSSNDRSVCPHFCKETFTTVTLVTSLSHPAVQSIYLDAVPKEMCCFFPPPFIAPQLHVWISLLPHHIFPLPSQPAC